jgi:ABC-type multidrug transport system fused ATPase/permease subunit
MVAFIEYQMLIFQPLMNISNVYAQYQSAMSGVERMFDVLDTEIEVSLTAAPDSIKYSAKENAG